MKKSTFLFALAMLALASACHQPEYVQPTADRQGITSLAAYFAFGPYEGQELGRLEIANPDVDRYVIPIPWYFPETSDDITTPYLTRVRVRASLEANCKIEPALSVLDLTEENHFTYTDATGTSRNIIITGERVKSSKCELLSFSLKRPMLNGIIDKSTRQVSLITANDLSVAEATVTLSAHATISPDPAEAHNYNEGFTFTVTADDGTTKADYYVVKNVPQKIDYGVNTTSAEKLFNLDPSSGLGLPAFNTQANVSLAVLDSWLIVNMGDGSAPKYFNKIMATAGGTLKIGNAVPTGAIASDEQDHLLLCNLAEPGEVFNIWKTSSVSQAPELLYSFTNNQDLQLGLEMKVIGDVEKEAVISVTYPGLAGVTTSGRFHAIHIVGGEVVSSEVIDLFTASGGAFFWGSGPANSTCVVAGSPRMDGGWYSCAYSENSLRWFKQDLSLGSIIPGEGVGESEDAPGGGYYVNGNVDPNNLDTKCFNNARYLVLFVSNHFPKWWPGPQLYVFDITGGSLSDRIYNSPQLVFSVPFMYNEQYQTGSNEGFGACGDAILAPSADGYMLYIYYYDHFSGMIGGYSLDCIKR
ncbi:MAG: DUF5018 domain-containing protein [Bacteroidales bacterium]|nr:DUF5018 domain-containing protein [Bacteroidales bacterium]